MLDKTPIYIGSPPRHREFITIRQGALAYKLAKQVDSHAKFTIQLLAACCLDYSIDRPCKVFEPDIGDIKTELDKAHQLAKKLAKA